MDSRLMRTGGMSATGAQSSAKGSSASEVVYLKILESLYSGRLVPGQRLVESDLIHNYKASRGSIREALKSLAAEGVVSVSLHKGAQIRWLSREEVDDALAMLVLAIGFAGKLAAERIHIGDHRAKFRRASQDLLDLERDQRMSPKIMAARDHFFRLMVSIGGNRALVRLYPSMDSHSVRVQLKALPVPFQDFRNMTESILAADPRRAEQACRAHVQRQRRDLSKLPDEAFAPSSQ